MRLPDSLIVPALASALLLHFTAGMLTAQDGASGWADDPPALASLVDFGRGQSDLRVAVERYAQDRQALFRRYDIPYSAVRRDRMRDFYAGWMDRLEDLDFDGLNHEGQVDYVLLRTKIEFELEMLAQEEIAVAEMQPLVPFGARIGALQEARRARQGVDARETAGTLDDLAGEVEALTGRMTGGGAPEGFGAVKGVVAERAAGYVGQLRRMLRGWHGFHTGYDPLFTWWVAAPYERLDAALEAHQAAIRRAFVGEGADDLVVGDPIGDEGLRAHLAHEMVSYSADELIRIAEAEFTWMEEELLRASREMGYGDDWGAAQEAVKNLAVDPGQKPAVVRELERQSSP